MPAPEPHGPADLDDEADAVAVADRGCGCARFPAAAAAAASFGGVGLPDPIVRVHGLRVEGGDVVGDVGALGFEERLVRGQVGAGEPVDADVGAGAGAGQAGGGAGVEAAEGAPPGARFVVVVYEDLGRWVGGWLVWGVGG